MNTLQEATAKEPQIPPSILVMEDEMSVAKGLELVLSEEGYRVDLAATGKDALERFNQKEFDLLVADLRLPDINGMEVIKQVKKKRPKTEVVVITGYASVPTAVDALKLGAFDYLPKPFTEDQIKIAVDGALKGKESIPSQEIIQRVALDEEEKLIQKQEVIRVLNRTAENAVFWKDLMERGSDALEGYRLSGEAKAAIVSGDLNWILENVGRLTPRQLDFIYARLEREAW
ncbi:MAG: response regulator [Desulfobacterales bacterium]|nr:MAG: response regulator [Desulfobacterales bacterium]